MKKTLSLVLAAILLLTGLPLAGATSVEVEEYTVAEKLTRQIGAGSGFSGTLTVSAAPNAAVPQTGTTLQKPLNFTWDYIYVRQTQAMTEERRLDILLKNGETVESGAHLQMLDGALNLQADWLGEEWFSLLPAPAAASAEVDAGATDTVSALVGSAVLKELSRTSLSGLIGGFYPILTALNDQNGVLNTSLDAYLTSLDVWLENYRQRAELIKEDDGAVSMELNYAIPPSDIKVQLKQMVSSMMEDQTLIYALVRHFGAETVNPLLMADLMPYYEAAIDALPLENDLTLSRTVSMTGETLALYLSLPFYDVNSGSVTLSYDRVQAQNDVPAEYAIGMESEKQSLVFKYQINPLNEAELSGSFVSEPDAASGLKPIAVSFKLNREETVDKDAESRDVLTQKWELALAPDAERQDIITFDPLTLKLTMTFASKTQKSASTELDAVLELGGDTRPLIWTFVLNGKTRKQWTPAEIPTELRSISAMSSGDVEALLAAAALRAGVTLLPYLTMDADAAAKPEASLPADTTPEATVPPDAAPEATVPPDAAASPEVSVAPSVEPAA